MTTHSNILAWEIPWTKLPGGQQSMGSRRVRHNLVTKPAPAPWRLNVSLLLHNSPCVQALQDPCGLQMGTRAPETGPIDDILAIDMAVSNKCPLSLTKGC